MVSQGTQVFSRQQIASAGLPDYVREAEALIESATHEKDRGARTGMFEKALLVVQTAVGTNKRALHDCILLAECNWELVRAAESIEFLKEAIQLAPKDARPYALLGRYLLYKGLRDQALNFLDRAIQLDPEDHGTRKLRERAALQQKKQYTVVINAADIGALGDKKKESVAQKHKAEATRLIDLGQINAASLELQKAEHGAQNELDRALSAVLGGSFTNADVGILVPEAQGKSAGGIVRTILAFIMIITVGVVFGLVVDRLTPSSGGTPEENVADLILSDKTSSLLLAAEKSDEAVDEALSALGALAHAILFVEQSGEVSHREAARSLLETMPKDMQARPASLLARALMIRVGPADGADVDGSIDSDIDAALETAAANPFVQMAKSERLRQSGDDEGALVALRAAAFGPTPSNRALHALARREASAGRLASSLALTETLLKRAPHHGGALALALAVSAAGLSSESGDEGESDEGDDAISDDESADSEDEEEEETEESDDATTKPNDGDAEKTLLARVLATLDDTEIESIDAAPAAIVAAMLAATSGDDTRKDRTLNIAIGSSGSGPITQNPMLLEAVTTTRILDFDAKGALTLLERNGGLVDTTVALQRNVTRATILDGIGDQIRAIKLQSPKPSLVDNAFALPAGRLVIDYGRTLIPLTAEFDGRFFPEAAIQVALELKGISPTVAKRKLATVADIKLAQISLARGNPQKGREYLTRARQSADSDPEYHLMSALVSTAQNDKPGARDAIEEALDLAPDEPRVLLAAARIQLSSGDAGAALRSVKKLKDEGYASPAALAIGARALARKGDVEGARSAIVEARTIAEDDVELSLAEIVVEDMVGEPERAVLVARAITKKSSARARLLADADEDASPYLHHALARLKSGATSFDALKAMTEKSKNNATAHYLIGLHLLGKKNTRTDGIETLKRASAMKGPPAAAAKRKLDELDAKSSAPQKESPKPKKKKKKKKKNR